MHIIRQDLLLNMEKGPSDVSVVLHHAIQNGIQVYTIRLKCYTRISANLLEHARKVNIDGLLCCSSFDAYYFCSDV